MFRYIHSPLMAEATETMPKITAISAVVNASFGANLYKSALIRTSTMSAAIVLKMSEYIVPVCCHAFQ
jgi:hypothetical protein